jgi:general secretion pathway protein F
VTSFRYEAFGSAGELQRGEIEAVSIDVAIEALQGRGWLPVTAEASAGRNSATAPSWLHRDLFAKTAVPDNDLAVATHELGTLLQAGLALDQTLETVIEVTESRRLKHALTGALAGIRAGGTLADALASQGRTFPALALGLVRAGEHSGALDIALLRLSEFLSKAHAVRESIRSALVYPIILLIVAGLSLTLIVTVVLPQFKPLFRDAGRTLPLPTRIVMVVGETLQQGWWAYALILLALVVGARLLLSMPLVTARWHALLLRLPMFGALIAKTEAARFTRTLGTLLAAGMPVPAAHALAVEVIGNRAVHQRVSMVASSLREGQGLAAPLLRANVFPPLVAKLARVGEETGRLSAMLIKTADIYERDVQRVIERLLAVLAPALTVGLGGLIAAIIASVLMAILGLNELAF